MDARRASAQVFELPELLQIILLELNLRDLLLVQRTSHAFRSTVQDSICLRRKLFLEPDWDLQGRLINASGSQHRSGRKPENNRLLLRAFPGYYPTITLVIANDGSSSAPEESALSTASAFHPCASEEWSWDVCISFPSDRTPTCAPAVEYPEASWRRMYLSQPPCQSLNLIRQWQGSTHPAVVRESGITLGDVVAEATKTTPECQGWDWHRSYVSSDGDWHFEGKIGCNSVSG